MQRGVGVGGGGGGVEREREREREGGGGVHRTCAETAAVSRGTSDVTTKQRCKNTNSVDIQDVLCKATVTHSESYD